MDSGSIEEMAMDIPKLCGIKLTCRNIEMPTCITGDAG
jgi:hypothetical protein